jgi:hypothetical protein
VIRRLVTSRWTLVALAIIALSAGHLWPFGLLALTRTVSLVELEWSLAATIGIVYSANFIRECRDDAVAADLGDEATRETVEAFVLIGVVLLGLHTILLALGVVAMGNPTSTASISPGVRALEVVLTLAGELLVLALLVIRRKRARVRELALLQLVAAAETP